MDRVDHHPAGLHRLLPVAEKRNPARQIRILHTDQGGVAVVHQLDGARRNRIDPSGARGRDDHQQLTVEGIRALQLAEQHRQPAFIGVGGLQTGVHPDGFLSRGVPLTRVSSPAVGAAGDEVAPLVTEAVPGRERGGGLPDLSGSSGWLTPGPCRRVLRLEDAARADQEAAVQHTVDEGDDQHHDDGGSDEERHLVVQVPAPDQQPGKQFDRIDEHSPGPPTQAAPTSSAMSSVRR